MFDLSPRSRVCPWAPAPVADRARSKKRSSPAWSCLLVLTAATVLADPGTPRPALDPWGDPLPAGRWPAPYAERISKGVASVIVVDTTADIVGMDGDCSLREAIDNANAGADTTGGDCEVASIITFDPATDGIPIVLTGAADEDANVSGDLDIAVDVTLIGNGRDATILDGGEIDRVLHVLSSADTFALEGIEIRNGQPPEAGSDGGGILVAAHTALRDCRLRDSVALAEGGAVSHGFDDDLLLERCEVLGNQADQGAGVGGFGDTILLEIVDCLFEGNTATGRGGAVFRSTPEGTTRIVGTTMTGNSSLATGHAGGAVSHSSASGRLSIVDSTFEGNHGDAGQGGAIKADGFAGPILLERVTIAGNTAARGGGVDLRGAQSQVTLVNTTISGNESSGNGGGIYASSIPARIQLAAVTLTGNVADADADGTGDGGGLFAEDGGNLFLGHVLIAGNDDGSPGSEAPDCRRNSFSINSEGFNLIGDPTGCSFTGRTEDDIVGVAPGLGPLGDHGGATPTHLPLAGSPARDAGDPAGCRGPLGEPLPADQRGVSRALDGDDNGVSRCDIGAVEAHPMLPVSGDYCRTPAADIPDGGFAVDSLAVQESFPIDGLDVRLVVEHGRTGDLVFELSHGATTLTLLDRPNAGAGDCAGWHAGLIFDDDAPSEAQASCTDAATAYTPLSRHAPAQPLSTFDTQDAQGAWNLTVYDQATGETGRLLAWCLEPFVIFADGFELGDTSAWSATVE